MRSLAWKCAACVIVVGVLGCAKDDADQVGATINADGESQRPSVRLLDLDGRPVDLWKPNRHAVQVAVFTRTDCPISNQCAPEICRLYAEYHARGVEFFLIYVDPREQPDDIRRHLREYGYPCPALRDPEHSLVAYCSATATPEAVVFGKDRTIMYRGRIDDRYSDIGQPRSEATTHDLADAIESTISGKPVAQPRTRAVGCSIADLRN